MSEQFGQIRDQVFRTLTETTSAAIDFAPKLLGALVVLVIGWILARVVQAVVERSIRAGLETLLERTGVAERLERSTISVTPTAIVGRLFFWLLMILFVMAAAEVVGLTAVTNAITTILGYIPSVISAALVLAAGVFLARFVGNLVTSAGAAADLSYARGLGAVANTSIAVMVGVVALEQLGVDTQILMTVITVTVAALMAGMGLAFALGARDVIRAILAGHYLRQSLVEGTPIEVGGERGVLQQIGPTSTVLRDGERSWSVPNTKLFEETIGL